MTEDVVSSETIYHVTAKEDHLTYRNFKNIRVSIKDFCDINGEMALMTLQKCHQVTSIVKVFGRTTYNNVQLLVV